MSQGIGANKEADMNIQLVKPMPGLVTDSQRF
jgi:hypothetical protein